MQRLGTYYRSKGEKAVGLGFGVRFVVWFVWAFFFFLTFDLLPKFTY